MMTTNRDAEQREGKGKAKGKGRAASSLRPGRLPARHRVRPSPPRCGWLHAGAGMRARLLVLSLAARSRAPAAAAAAAVRFSQAGGEADGPLTDGSSVVWWSARREVAARRRQAVRKRTRICEDKQSLGQTSAASAGIVGGGSAAQRWPIPFPAPRLIDAQKKHCETTENGLESERRTKSK